MRPTLYIFGGLPGSGKSTLARVVARAYGAAYLRVDTIEQCMRDEGVALRGPEGYAVCWAVAADTLGLGVSVVADMVNPIAVTRERWVAVAERAGVTSICIHVACGDPVEHRRRVEGRTSEVPGLVLPTWDAVCERDFEPWPEADVLLDTAGETPAASGKRLLSLLAARDGGAPG